MGLPKEYTLERFEMKMKKKHPGSSRSALLLQLCGQRALWMLVLEMLLVRLGVRHRRLAD